MDCNADNYKTNPPQTVKRSSAQTVRKRSWWARRLSFAHFFQIIISNWCFFPTVCMQMMGPQAKFQMGFPYDVSSQPYQRSAPKHSFFIKTSSYCVCMQVWFAGLHQFSRKLLVLQKCTYKSPKQPISTSLQKYTTSHPPRANNHLSGANKTLPALHSTEHTAHS